MSKIIQELDNEIKDCEYKKLYLVDGSTYIKKLKQWKAREEQIEKVIDELPKGKTKGYPVICHTFPLDKKCMEVFKVKRRRK